MSCVERPGAGSTVPEIISQLGRDIISRLLGDVGSVGTIEVVLRVEDGAQGRSTHWAIRRRIGGCPEHGRAPHNTGDA